MVKLQIYDRATGDIEERQRKILATLEDISFPGYDFVLHRVDAKEGGAQFFLQVYKLHPVDAEGLTGYTALQHYSFALNGADDEQTVKAVYEQIVMMEMHEVAEHFRYKGKRVYQPHIHPETLVGFVSRLRKRAGFYREE